MIPEGEAKVPADYRASARQVHELDGMRATIVPERDLFRDQPVAVAAARVAASSLGAWNDHAAERLRLRASWRFFAQQRQIRPRAENPRPEAHSRTPHFGGAIIP